jgi:hypothetical protein
LPCTSSPSSMLLILRFGLLMELLYSCIFLSQLLSCLTKIFLFFLEFLINIQALRFCLPLVLLCWSSTPCHFTVFFVWLKGLFISRISVWFFF